MFTLATQSPLWITLDPMGLDPGTGPWNQLWHWIHSYVWTYSSSKSSPVLQHCDMQPLVDRFKVEPSCNVSAPSWDSICCYCSVAQPCSTFATPQTARHQASLSCTISRCLLKPMSIKSVMPSDHLILCHSLFLLPLIILSIRDFPNESVLPIRWPEVLQLQYEYF